MRPRNQAKAHQNIARPQAMQLIQHEAPASPELLKFAYDAGLGEKNAMGSGVWMF